MSMTEVGAVALTLVVFLALAHGLGFLFEKWRQPRLIGEILAGVLLGPFVLGQAHPTFFSALTSTGSKTETVLRFLEWVGLFLLMFLSGSETRRLLARENRKEIAWLLGVGTPLPFFLVLALGLGSWLPISLITGPAQQELSALLVLAIAVSVTSIPVISRIFYDLKILHTRFASLVLGSAVLEDILLWGVLAVATGLVGQQASIAVAVVTPELVSHTAITVVFTLVGLTLAPWLLRFCHHSRWNLIARASPQGYIFCVLFAYIAIAAALNVNLIFGSFLAGFGLVGGLEGRERVHFSSALETISKVALSFFIPLYFVMVGFKLNWGRDFSFSMLVIFLIGSSLIALLANGLAARLAGFRGLDVINLAVTTNARGGPGIVLASVAFEAGLINAAFYTTLVLTAILTSQAAGAWLRFVLSKGWPLLTETDDGHLKKN